MIELHDGFVDLRLVHQVWRNIESNEDPQLWEKKTELRAKFGFLFAKCSIKNESWVSTEALNASLRNLAKARALPPEELLEVYWKVINDVGAFVEIALDFYEIVASYRPLTEEEEQALEAMFPLLTQTMELVKRHRSSGIGDSPCE